MSERGPIPGQFVHDGGRPADLTKGELDLLALYGWQELLSTMPERARRIEERVQRVMGRRSQHEEPPAPA
jgi:hypothetical protein